MGEERKRERGEKGEKRHWIVPSQMDAQYIGLLVSRYSINFLNLIKGGPMDKRFLPKKEIRGAQPVRPVIERSNSSRGI